MNSQNPMDAEFTAMKTIYDTLEPLETDARSRVIDYIASRLEITVNGKAIRKSDATEEVPEAGGQADDVAVTHESLADLFDAAKPKGNPERALLSGYWLQVHEGADGFDSQTANKELKHLGEGIPNITSAFDGLKSRKPALALQLKKGGKSRQARKQYKITTAGIKAVEAMIRQ